MAANDPLNVELGPCSVSFGGVDLGFTIGGVTVTYSPDFHETKVDQFTGPVERWLQGEKLSAKVPMAEKTLANIKAAITANTGTTSVAVGSKSGKRMSSLAKLLVLHPTENATGDKSDDVNIWKAHVTSDVAIDYKPDGERILEVTFEGLVDTTRTDGSYLGLIGDSAA